MNLIIMLGIICAASAADPDEDPLLKEKLKTLMAKNTPGAYISLNDFMGFVDEYSLTEKEEDEFLELEGGNVSYVRITLKVLQNIIIPRNPLIYCTGP